MGNDPCPRCGAIEDPHYCEEEPATCGDLNELAAAIVDLEARPTGLDVLHLLHEELVKLERRAQVQADRHDSPVLDAHRMTLTELVKGVSSAERELRRQIAALPDARARPSEKR